MKLLSPAVTKDNTQAEVVRGLLRSQEMEKIAAKSRKELANAEADFSNTLAKNRDQWAKEEEEHENRLNEMSSEIANLEAKKQQALVPVDKIHQEAVEKLEEAEGKLSFIAERELELEDMQDRLENKLDEVGAREQDLLKRSQELESKRLGVEQQSASVVSGIKQLNQQTADFTVLKAKEEQNIQERKTSVALVETSLVVRDQQLKDREKDLKEQSSKIELATQQLAAKRKESLIPVEILEAKAQKELDLAVSSRKQATLDQNRSAELLKQAQIDYDTKLVSLKKRETEILKNEQTLQAKQKDLANRERLLSDAQNVLHETEKQLIARQQVLDVQETAILEDRENIKEQVLSQTKELEKERAANLKLFQETKELHDKQLVLVKEQQELKAQNTKKLEQIEQKTEEQVTLMARTQLKIQNIATEVSELDQNRAAFAVWRRDAEKVIEDQALVNSKKQQELTDKEDKLKRQEKFLADWATQLKDQRGVLDRALAKIKEYPPSLNQTKDG